MSRSCDLAIDFQSSKQELFLQNSKPSAFFTPKVQNTPNLFSNLLLDKRKNPNIFRKLFTLSTGLSTGSHRSFTPSNFVKCYHIRHSSNYLTQFKSIIPNGISNYFQFCMNTSKRKVKMQECSTTPAFIIL